MTIEEPALTFCANHPQRETRLRCNRCGKPICAQCAILTPTGYRCKECVRSQQKIFDTASWPDYLLGFIVAAILSLIGSQLIGLIGRIGFIGWFLVIAGSPTAGMIIAEGARLVIHRHRSRELFLTIAAAVVLGALPAVLANLLRFNLFGLIFQGIYLFLAASSAYTRLSGIRLFK
jgi:hypothetical protein